MCAEGDGVPKDDVEAEKWFSIAKAKGDGSEDYECLAALAPEEAYILPCRDE